MEYDQRLLTNLLGDEAAIVSQEVSANIDFAHLEGTSELVADMLKGKKPGTRLFLRPIYKFCKHMITDENHPTVPRTSKCWIPFQKAIMRDDPHVETKSAGIRWRRHTNFALSFAIAEWIVQLSTIGDKDLNIPIQSHLQPAYAFNTIITMGQRASAAIEARAAYARMCYHKLSPDVFTMTALIDVLGRAHEVSGAFWFFKQMTIQHDLDPNVVTLVTSARVSIVHRSDEFFYCIFNEMIRLYQQASPPPLLPHLHNEHQQQDQAASSLSSCTCSIDKDKDPQCGKNKDSISRMCGIIVMSSFECCIGAERLDLTEYILEKAKSPLNVSPTKKGIIGVLYELYHEEFNDKMKESLVDAMFKWEKLKLIPETTTQDMMKTISSNSTGNGGTGASLSSLRRIEIKMKHHASKKNTSEKQSIEDNRNHDEDQPFDEEFLNEFMEKTETEGLGSGNENSSSFSAHAHRESLGANSPPELRTEVVEHDISRLEYRLESKGQVSKEDFETLIHQCRKRKWDSEVHLILTAMNRLAAKHAFLRPDAYTVCVVVDAFVDSGSPRGALAVLQSVHNKSTRIVIPTSEVTTTTTTTITSPNENSQSLWTRPISDKWHGQCEGSMHEIGEGHYSVAQGGARIGDTSLVFDAISLWLTELSKQDQVIVNDDDDDEQETKIFEITKQMMCGALKSLGEVPQLALTLLYQFYKMTNLMTPNFKHEISWISLLSILIESSAVLSQTDSAILNIIDTISQVKSEYANNTNNKHTIDNNDKKQDKEYLEDFENHSTNQFYEFLRNEVNLYHGCHVPLNIALLMSSAAVVVTSTSTTNTSTTAAAVINTSKESPPQQLSIIENVVSYVQQHYCSTLEHNVFDQGVLSSPSSLSFTSSSSPTPPDVSLLHLKFMCKLPMFPSILMEAFGRCPLPTIKKVIVSTRNKRKASHTLNHINQSTNLKAPIDSLPFKSFIRPNLLSCIHKRNIWLKRVFHLMNCQFGELKVEAKKESESLMNVDNSDVEESKKKKIVEGISEDKEDEGIRDGKCIHFWESYFSSCSSDMWSSNQSNHNNNMIVQENNNDNKIDCSNNEVNAKCNDEYLFLVSSGELTCSELGALLRLQRIYVRTLITRDKKDKIKLIEDLKSIFKVSKSSQSLGLISTSLSSLSSPYLQLPDKMQMKLGKLICAAVQEVNTCTHPSLISAQLQGCGIEVLREVYNSFVIGWSCNNADVIENNADVSLKTNKTEIETETASDENMIKEKLKSIEHVRNFAVEHLKELKRDKIMKVAQFLKELRIEQQTLNSHINSDDNNNDDEGEDGIAYCNIDLFNLILDLQPLRDNEKHESVTPNPTSEAVDAAICFVEDGLEKEFVLYLKDRGLIHLASQLACRFTLTSDPMFLELVHTSDHINFSSLNSINMNEPLGTLSVNHQTASLTSSLTKKSINNNLHYHGSEVKDYLKMDDLNCTIHLVQDLESVEKAIKLLHDSDVSAVGIDAEWQPIRGGGGGGGDSSPVTPVAVLQISTRSDAFLFDLLVLEGLCQPTGNTGNIGTATNIGSTDMQEDDKDEVASKRNEGEGGEEEEETRLDKRIRTNENLQEISKSSFETMQHKYRELILWLLSTQNIKKYGFGVKEDIRRLKQSFSSFHDIRVNPPLIDFRDDVRFKQKGGGGLSSACTLMTGKSLDKTMQTSNWGMRPLSRDQIHYAALDARCILELLLP
eukprot:CAMPEP_0114341440 /NCGR_PEP_ID=MMETSP0101-20121206/9049_1 /TAXON_ID=38822 ORGANISM="Pteridomonas danica, Strain PT" /NCGR_SAMPLE_ID=MMETSP0101 /ASSEMBLY_ACC=CAM_ASM_000211 /LENGTH=1699 /DNA_ID=CAMNT_0001475045 /DNA_START=42 /DNA_END=5141 /DNA_ORIENTATION=+